MTVLLIGDKPSAKNTDPKIAFVGTQSHSTVLKWCKTMGFHTPYFANRVDDNLQTRLDFAKKFAIPIIALGQQAAKHLSALDVDYFKLPHPSGRNRALNDKFELELLLESCRDWAATFSTGDQYAE